jgi:hypothetical protein
MTFSSTASRLLPRWQMGFAAGLCCSPACAHRAGKVDTLALTAEATATTVTTLDFRNTWNDIFILSSAVNRSATLITEDNLLSRFAADLYRAKSQHEDTFLSLAADRAYREGVQKGERVATHVRSFITHQHSTLKEHMPRAHQNYLEWTPSRMLRWAEKISPHTAALIEKITSPALTPSKPTAPVLGSCAWRNTIPNSVWRMPL